MRKSVLLAALAALATTLVVPAASSAAANADASASHSPAYADFWSPDRFGGVTTPDGVLQPTDFLASATGADLTASAATPGTTYAGFNSIQPARVLDTRLGIGAPASAVGPDGVVTVALRGVAGVPADADSVILNVTAVGATLGGYVTIWPADQPRPNASNLNMTPGQTIANLVVTDLSASGAVSFANAFGETDLLADVVGWARDDQHTHAIVPTRVLDSRQGLGLAVSLAGGQAADITIAGVAGLPATGVGVAVLNVTVTNPTATSYLTLWPSGTAKPNASNLNYSPGQTVPNLVFASVGTNGKVSLFNSAGSADVIADLVAWIPSGAAFAAMTPVRVMDTRTGYGNYGVASPAGLVKPVGSIGADQVDLDLRAWATEPGATAAYVLNVTVLDASDQSYLTAWPTGSAQPVVSNLNYPPHGVTPNLVVVKAGTLGRVSLRNFSGTAHVIVDLVGIVPLRNSTDALDADGASKFHVVVINGSDAPANPGLETQIRSEVDAFDTWLASETITGSHPAGQHLNLDRANAQIEVTTWTVGYTTAQLVTYPDTTAWLFDQMNADGWGDPYGRHWLYYVNATRPTVNGGGLCGITWKHYTSLFMQSACGQVTGNVPAADVGGAITARTNTAEVAIHEMLHGLGAVPRCAPHYDTVLNPGHVNTTTDLMHSYANAGITDGGGGKHIDPGRDDYWGPGACFDVSKSPYLTQG
jgi:hypothetical protein